VWKLCSQQQIWSVFAKKRGVRVKAGPPVHDDFVKRNFAATRANELWLTDISEPRPVRASAISAPSKMFTPTELLVTPLTRARKHPLRLMHCAMQSFCVHQQTLWCTQIADHNFAPKPSCGC